MHETLAAKLGTFRAWNWLLNRRPWQVTVILLCLSPGMLWLLDVLVVRGYVVPPSYQWFSAQCDILLAVGGGVMARHLKGAPAFRIHRRWLRNVVHGGLIAGWYAFAVFHMWQESGSVATWERRLGPTGIYHNFVLYPLIGYPLTLMFVATLAVRIDKSCAGLLRILLSLLCVTGWLSAGVYDGEHQLAPNGVDKHVYSSPGPPYSGNPWCGGLLTRHMCG